MSHMKPEIIEGKWYAIDGTSGTTYVPADVVGNVVIEDEEPMFIAKTAPALADYYEGDIESAEIIEGFGARLSAPGYMDCTDWTVCVSEDEARRELAEAYDLCEKCLGGLNADYECTTCNPKTYSLTWEPGAVECDRDAVAVVVEQSAAEVKRTENGLEFQIHADLCVDDVLEAVRAEARSHSPITVMTLSAAS